MLMTLLALFPILIHCQNHVLTMYEEYSAVNIIYSGITTEFTTSSKLRCAALCSKPDISCKAFQMDSLTRSCRLFEVVLCDMQSGNHSVYVPFNLTCSNEELLSQGKPSVMSSVYGLGDDYPALNGNDGDLTNLFHTSTGNGEARWWRVDLLQICLVTKVNFLNRKNCPLCWERANDLVITVSEREVDIMDDGHNRCGVVGVADQYYNYIECDNLMKGERLAAAKQKLGIVHLRPFQQDILAGIQSGSDMMVFLPTGYGKSLSFQLAPFLNSETSCVIVVMPLNSLMSQQDTMLRTAGMDSIYLHSASQVAQAFTASRTHIFTSPELLLGKLKDHMVDLPENEKSRLTHIFIDESHCITQWGQSKTGRRKKSVRLQEKQLTAFRREYSQIGDIRAVLPKASVVSLTATATKSTEEDIRQSLSIPEDAPVIKLSPNKPNIKYSVLPMKETISDPHSPFTGLSRYLQLFGQDSQRFLIFTRQKSQTGMIYEFLVANSPEGMVEMYHSQTDDKTKEDIIRNICDSQSRLRVVVCTSAFSMGMDIPNLTQIIHYGVPSTIQEYVQESGRAGRGGEGCHAVVLRHRDSLRGEVDDSMKKYITGSECRRKLLMNEFGESTPDSPRPVGCCDLCSLRASCCSCSTDVICNHREQQCYCVRACGDISPFISYSVSHAPVVSNKVRAVMTPDNLARCRTTLIQSFPETAIGISEMYPSLLDNIMITYTEIDSVHQIYKAGAYTYETCERVLAILDLFSPVIGYSSATDEQLARSASSSDNDNLVCSSSSSDGGFDP